jgi:hypothetical protein
MKNKTKRVLSCHQTLKKTLLQLVSNHIEHILVHFDTQNVIESFFAVENEKHISLQRFYENS